MNSFQKTLLVILFFNLCAANANSIIEEEVQLPVEVTLNGVELILVPAGWFWYSSLIHHSLLAEGVQDYRNVKIWLDSFYMAKYEARAKDLIRFLNSEQAPVEVLEQLAKKKEQVEKDIGEKRPLCAQSQNREGKWVENFPDKNMPATDLSWLLADSFAKWMGLRLPTKLEWQKGARGMSDERYWPWGNQYPDDTFGSFGWTRKCSPSTVDSYPKGQSPFGLYNMAGNVSEFVSDWYSQSFEDSLVDGVRNPPEVKTGDIEPYDGPMKVAKGGVWSRDILGTRIKGRRIIKQERATSRSGVRFAADVSTVLQYLERNKQ